MNEKTSSLFDNELEISEIDSLLSKKNRGADIRAAMQYYQTISESIQGKPLSRSNLTDKIVAAIDKEPTQLGGFLDAKNN